MKVFLTGATGVVGRPTVARLVAAGHEVRAVSRRDEASAALRGAGAEPVSVDLFDPAAVKGAVDGAEAIVHLATSVPPLSKASRRRSWAMHNRLRTEATRHLVDAARANGVTRIVKESVTFVYADGGDAWLDEQSPLLAELGMLAPTIEGEETALALAGGGDAVVLRFALFYGGAGNRGTDEMLRLARWRNSMVAGKPSAYMSSLHTDDAAAAVVAALDAPTGVYNVVDDEPTTRRDYLDAFAAAFHTSRLRTTPGWVVRIAAGAAADALTGSQRVSNAKFKAVTGWSPQHPTVREGWRAEAAAREDEEASNA